jgi:XTP/dITP diphosphohydrolase
VLILVRHHNDPAPLVTDGRWYGELAREFRGDEGFGYDPVFLDPKMQLTGSEMTTNQKNELSHRGEAVRKMKLLLESGAF